MTSAGVGPSGVPEEEEEPVRITTLGARMDGVGCRELGQTNQLDVSLCCEICHSADGQTAIGALGPCRVALPDGRSASVCCAGRKQLLDQSRLSTT